MNSDYFKYDPGVSIITELDNKKIRLQNYDNTHSISTGFSGTLLNFQYTLRLNTNIKHSQIVNNSFNNSYKYDLKSFYTMINLSTDIAHGHNIGFNYSNTTMFPQNYQLNPFTDYSDSSNIITGNPLLKASTNRQYSLLYLYSENNTTINISGGYWKVSDLINSVISPIAPGVTKTSYANIASQENLSFRAYAYKKLFNSLELSSGFNIGKTKFSGVGIQNEGTNWGTYLYSLLSFSNIRFEASINYSSASVSVQEKSKPDWSMDAGAKLLLLNKALSLTLRATDLFNTKNNNTNTSGTGLSITNNIRQTTRIVSLSLSYYFKLEAQETIEIERPFDVLPSEF
jgi:hypothetical protein